MLAPPDKTAAGHVILFVPEARLTDNASSYWDIAGVKGKCWSYDNPSDRFKGLKGYLSFYAAPWDCYVDGEKVEAQPGDFYGKQSGPFQKSN